MELSQETINMIEDEGRTYRSLINRIYFKIGAKFMATKYEAAQKRADELQENLNVMTKGFDSANEVVLSQREKINELQAEVERLTEEVLHLNADRGMLIETLTILERENDDLIKTLNHS